MTLFRCLRILLLLIIFVAVAFYAKSQKLNSRAWLEPLEVVIFPMDGDDSVMVKNYIKQLDERDFISIENFFIRESQYYTILAEQPVKIRLGPSLDATPPPSPKPGSNVFSIIWWGIKFRIWAMQNTPDEQSNHQRVRIFLHYHENSQDRILQHSLGLDKGLLAIVHGFADQQQNPQNNIIIAHELLHTVGALDKYDQNSEPIFPDGYAAPEQSPLFPQHQAEIMSARIALSANSSRMANNLNECMIAYQTALEINWVNSEAED